MFDDSFLPQLMFEFKGEHEGDYMFVKQGRKRIKAAFCDHAAGHWVLTPEGEAFLGEAASPAAAPAEEPVAEPTPEPVDSVTLAEVQEIV